MWNTEKSEINFILSFICLSITYYYYYYYHHNHFTPFKFFPSALAGGLSVESEWQQVSTSLQDSSQYSGWSKNAVVWMVSIHSLISLFQFFGYWSKCTNYYWYYHHSHAPLFISSLARSKCLFLFSLFLFSLCGLLEWQNLQDDKFSFFCSIIYFICNEILCFFTKLERTFWKLSNSSRNLDMKRNFFVVIY